MKQEMTIHEALSELKTIDARIYKKGAEFRPCVANKHSNTKIGGVPIEDFVADNKEKYQSVRDLINRRIAIKRQSYCRTPTPWCASVTMSILLPRLLK